MAEELAAKNAQLATFRDQELALRRQKQALEEKQANFQVEFERKLDEQGSLILIWRANTMHPFIEIGFQQPISKSTAGVQ